MTQSQSLANPVSVPVIDFTLVVEDEIAGKRAVAKTIYGGIA